MKYFRSFGKITLAVIPTDTHLFVWLCYFMLLMPIVSHALDNSTVLTAVTGTRYLMHVN